MKSILAILIIVILGMGSSIALADPASDAAGCPPDKTYDISVTGLGASFGTASSGAWGGATKEAEYDCNKRLAQAITNDGTDCMSYCMSGGCVGSMTDPTTNTCDVSGVSCSQSNYVTIVAMGIINQFIPIVPDPETIMVYCKLHQQSSMTCHCTGE